MDPNLTKMFGVVLASGAAGMIVGAVYGYFAEISDFASATPQGSVF